MLAIGVLIGAVLLLLVLRQVDVAQFRAQLSAVDARKLLAPLGITVAGALLRPYRWRAIFPPRVSFGFRESYIALSVGNLMNNVLPGRGGDIARCFLAGKSLRIEKASLAFATLIVEKTLDALALLVVVMLSFLVFAPPLWLRQLGVLAGVVVTAAVAVIMLLHHRTEWFLRQTRAFFRSIRLAGAGGRVVALFERFGEGLEVVSSARRMLWLGALTAVTWTLEALLVGALGSAFGIRLDVPQMFTVTAVLGLGLMIPSAPGFVGTYQFLVVSALGLFSVNASAAFALGVVMNVWVYLGTSLAGLVGLALGGNEAIRAIRNRREDAPNGGAERPAHREEQPEPTEGMK